MPEDTFVKGYHHAWTPPPCKPCRHRYNRPAALAKPLVGAKPDPPAAPASIASLPGLPRTALGTPPNRVSSDGEMPFLLRFAGHPGVCRSGVPVPSPSCWAGEEETRGRELRLTTLKFTRKICYDNLTCSVTQISSDSRSPLPPHGEKPVQNSNRRCRSGARTPPGFCLPVKIWDLGLIQFKSWGSIGKCRSAPGGTPSLFPSQTSTAEQKADAPNCKCGDFFGLGYFRNQVSRSGLEWILNVHSCICCISPQFCLADHTVQYWMPKITTEESVFILSVSFGFDFLDLFYCDCT